MTRRATPQPGVDRMVSTSWSGRRWSSPAARQGRALARGLEGRLPLQHHYVSDQNSSSSRLSGLFFSCPQTRYLPRSPGDMSAPTIIGLDIAKNVFQAHGADANGAPVLKRQIRRG